MVIPGLLLVMGPPACTRTRAVAQVLPKGLEGWKRQCGLLWVVRVQGGEGVRFRISGRFGNLLDYGGGFTVDDHQLASSFCRTDAPVQAAFHCILDSEKGGPVTGQLEAWYLGALLKTWTLRGVRHFEAQVALPV
ncbi:hypothetical protein [Mesoterricola silvestris]|nr:hypothetical protein [Mesoterricola silvestris]